jgi:hypothetical protein
MQVGAWFSGSKGDRSMERSKISTIVPLNLDRARSADAYWPPSGWPAKAKEWHGAAVKVIGWQ